MRKTTVMVTSNGRVVQSGLTSIFNCSGRYEVVGTEGKQVPEHVFELQPDILVFEITHSEELYLGVLENINLTCPWTKIILILGYPVSIDTFKKFIFVCHGYIQGRVRPGILCEVADIACNSDYFFLIGNNKEFKAKIKDDSPANNSNSTLIDTPKLTVINASLI